MFLTAVGMTLGHGQLWMLIFPTIVGMIRSAACLLHRRMFPHRSGDEPDAYEPSSFGLPHKRGDDPSLYSRMVSSIRYSPQVWDVPVFHLTSTPQGVFPTDVGMIRRILFLTHHQLGVPYMCGDEPSNEYFVFVWEDSPQAWG